MITVLKNLLFGRRVYDFYLCGPMRGYPELNRPLFMRVAKIVRSEGFTVWNPAEHDSYLQLSFAECMTADLNAVINDCRKIAMLPGWKQSLGGNMEVFTAFACGKEAIEVVVSDDGMSIGFSQFDTSKYRLPYQTDGEERQFDPHVCGLNDFSSSGE